MVLYTDDIDFMVPPIVIIAYIIIIIFNKKDVSKIVGILLHVHATQYTTFIVGIRSLRIRI